MMGLASCIAGRADSLLSDPGVPAPNLEEALLADPRTDGVREGLRGDMEGRRDGEEPFSRPPAPRRNASYWAARSLNLSMFLEKAWWWGKKKKIRQLAYCVR